MNRLNFYEKASRKVIKMNVRQISEKLGCKILSGKESLGEEITDGFCCDLLSFAIGRAPEGSIWMTVIGNINTVAVASLSGAACILLCEGVKPDAQALEKAIEEDIPILVTEKPAYRCALEIGQALDR